MKHPSPAVRQLMLYLPLLVCLLAAATGCSIQPGADGEAQSTPLQVSEVSAGTGKDSSGLYFYAKVKNTASDKTITGIRWKIEIYDENKQKITETFAVTKETVFNGFLKLLPSETKRFMIALPGSAGAAKNLTARASIIDYESSKYDPNWDKSMPVQQVEFVVR